MIVTEHSRRLIMKHGKAILHANRMQQEKKYLQHGNVSVYDHSVLVAFTCIWIARHLPIRTNIRALIRGALLHDYFLYDWHIPDKHHKWHGFRHARFALQNAEKDFILNDIEKNMILSHMFPLNIEVPQYRESVILCIADKMSAIREMIWGITKKKYALGI